MGLSDARERLDGEALDELLHCEDNGEHGWGDVGVGGADEATRKLLPNANNQINIIYVVGHFQHKYFVNN